MKKPELPPNEDFDFLASENMEILQRFDEVFNKIAQADTDYPYWESFRHKVKDIGISPAILWRFNKFQRSRTISKIRISDEPGFEFKYNTIPAIQKYLHEFDLNLGGVLDGSSIIPKEDRTRYLMSSIMEESIASSQIEGAVTTRQVAKEMLRTQRKPRDTSERMILNNYRTMQMIVENKNQKLTPELLCAIHESITSGTLDRDEDEGQFRTSSEVNVVEEISGEVFYTPPAADKIEQLVRDLCNFANGIGDTTFIHPIVRAIILHFLIGYIHPFTDGNGRTARAIFYWYLLFRNYWLAEYLVVSRIILKSKTQYAKAYLFAEYDENDLTYFIHYNLKSMDLALRSLKEYLQRKIEEKKSIFHLVHNTNLNERQAVIIKEMIIDEHRFYTIKEVQESFDVVYQTARTDLMKLAQEGFLEERNQGRKMIFLRAKGFDDKISKLKLN